MSAVRGAGAAECVRHAAASLVAALAGLSDGISDAQGPRLIALDEVRGSVESGPQMAELIDLIAGLERVKDAACAAQAELAVRFSDATECAQRERGVALERAGRGVAEQVALARGVSPHQGRVLLGAAKALVREMPQTLAALREGRLNERRAIIAVQETCCLEAEDRAYVDGEIAKAAAAEDLGERKLRAMICQMTYKRDGQAVLRRLEKAESERHVSIRPAADQMVWLTALLPLAQGVACFAALRDAARSAVVRGDGRGRGQTMADTLVERVTGRTAAVAADVELQVLISDAALLGASEEPAVLQGQGPVPVAWVRRLLRDATEEQRIMLRQAFAADGRLVAMESRARLVPAGLRRFLGARDQRCRTPLCDAPIREADHVTPWRSGGQTGVDNVQGLCRACNMAREAPGWRAVVSGHDGQITVVTPTGHRYVSREPTLPMAPSSDEVAQPP